MTDVPFGVLLSGGLDSSLVAAVALRHLAKAKVARQWGSQLHSFCIGLKVTFFCCYNLFVHVICLKLGIDCIKCPEILLQTMSGNNNYKQSTVQWF